MNIKNIVSVFESTLTRTLGLKTNELYDDIIIVKTYYFDVIRDIILNGFIYKNEKYIFFTASAGQIRTKKTVFIKESLFKKHMLSLMCGLTIEDINNAGGMNINKYLAYLALCNSATDVWEDFDIRKTIVVEDMETMVSGLVDFIDDKTYEITRQKMNIPICHTDGCGMILSNKQKKSMMVRLPWIKGLLVPFPFDRFIKEKNCSGIIKDIYGKEWDIINDGIEVIFTKSQFKMWKFYKDWQHYIDNYLKYKCHAGKCNEEEDFIKTERINYQMLQTLTDITNTELETICKRTNEDIQKISSDRNTMLKVFGVSKYNQNKNYLQQALEIYPELLSDSYTSDILKQIKDARIKEARSGKVKIDGKYAFITPDLYAFCEFLFLENQKPKGLLQDGEVFCKLYQDNQKLDCLRSPSLYREHAVRLNKINKEKQKWFITKGLYTSCHDLISKILMFDVDGDKSLVVAEKTIVEVAERNMNDIVPLYYNMAKAGVSLINNESIFEGLMLAYSGGNIGAISNDITKIWNSDNINLDVIKILCAENNFVIDYAKTLYKPTRPNHIKKLIAKYTKSKLPYFFIYAKDKDIRNVEKINDSVINRIVKMFPNIRMNFRKDSLGKFDYRMLLKNKDIELDKDIIKIYNKYSKKYYFLSNREKENDREKNNNAYIYKTIREELLSVVSDPYYITDVLVEYLFNIKDSKRKGILWECFGDVMVDNLKSNLKKSLDDGYIMCENCGIRVKQNSNKQKYCDGCAREKQLEWDREYQRKKYNSRVIENPLKPL